jgi:hypothetical protein
MRGAARDLADDLANLVIEGRPHQAGNRPMALLHGDARLVGELIDEAHQQSFGEHITPDFQAVAVVVGEGRYITGAGCPLRSGRSTEAKRKQRKAAQHSARQRHRIPHPPRGSGSIFSGHRRLPCADVPALPGAASNRHRCARVARTGRSASVYSIRSCRRSCRLRRRAA